MSTQDGRPQRRSHGDGQFKTEELAACGRGCVFEHEVLVFHPESVFVGDDVYVGHQTILKGYYKNEMHIGSGTWIGQQAFIHSAGGIWIGEDVGIGPGVKILSSQHRLGGHSQAILQAPLDFAPVRIENGADIGVGAIILPGVTIGACAQIGAGAVVSRNIPAHTVAYGVPAKVHSA